LRLASTVILASTIAMSGIQVQAADTEEVVSKGLTTLKFSSLMIGGEEAAWRGFTYLAQDTVESLNGLTSLGTEIMHDKLHMEIRSPWERALFLATVGQVQLRSVWATSLVAHEYAHFANAHRFGLTEHYFVDENTGVRFGTGEAWGRVFISGDPGGPATSARGDEEFNRTLFSDEGVEASLAGLNWQMRYSEHRLRGWLSGERRTVFDAADFLLNRGYTLAYAIGSHYGLNEMQHGGDPGHFIREMEEKYGLDHVSEKMMITSLVANFASKGVLQFSGSLTDYVARSETEVQPLTTATKSTGGIYLDVPQYLNKQSMSVSPTLYWIASGKNSGRGGDSDVMIGLGLEKTVFGKNRAEIRTTLDATWDKVGMSAGLSVGEDGNYFDFTASYDISKYLSMTAGGAVSSGSTLRGNRELPDAESVFWFGGDVRF